MGTKAASNPAKAASNPEKADEFKVRGNDCVKSGQYQKAIHYYTEAIRLNKFEPIYFSNRALCNLKLKRLVECVKDCTIAIGLDENCVKAYYRRMCAREERNEHLHEALNDCRKILSIEPKNVEAKKALERLEKAVKTEKKPKAKPEASNKAKNQIEAQKEPELQAAKEAAWSLFEGTPNYEQIDFVTKPPHLRSKEPLKRVKITEISASSSSNITESSSKAGADEENKKSKIEETDTATSEDHKDSIKKAARERELVIPKVAAQFHRSWSSVRSAEQKYAILKGIYQQNIASLLGSQFDVGLLTDILAILKQHFVPKNEPIINIMGGIVGNREMSIVALLMSDEDKMSFTKLITYMRSNGEDGAVIDEIQRKFEDMTFH